MNIFCVVTYSEHGTNTVIEYIDDVIVLFVGGRGSSEKHQSAADPINSVSAVTYTERLYGT